jgi:hypothetical protein
MFRKNVNVEIESFGKKKKLFLWRKQKMYNRTSEERTNINNDTAKYGSSNMVCKNIGSRERICIHTGLVYWSDGLYDNSETKDVSEWKDVTSYNKILPPESEI